MRDFEIKPELDEKLVKLSKRDKKSYQAVMNKIKEILACADVEHYKNLRYDMKDSKRAHIGHFILVFSYDEAKDFVSFEDYDHHDNVYLKK
ncbi:MAG: addiction module toxin RelE [archaeon]